MYANLKQRWAQRKGGQGVPQLLKWHHVIWIPFFHSLSFSLPELFFFFFSFWLRRWIIGTPSLPPPWPSCAGFSQIYFSKHLWTLKESRSLFAKGAFCWERFGIKPYQAALIYIVIAMRRMNKVTLVVGVNAASFVLCHNYHAGNIEFQ